MHFHLQGQSYQFKPLPFGFSTAPMEFTVVAKEVKLMALQRDVRIHQYLDDSLVRATSHQTCLQHTQTLVALCQELGWLVNKEKSELDPKQVFNFVGYQFDLKEGKVRPTLEHWQALINKIQTILSSPVSSPAVHVPDSLEKVIPVPRSLHPHLRWWMEESNVLPGQPLHPLKHALHIFTDASKEGWGAHLNEHIARGTWSLSESKLHIKVVPHINYLELNVVFLALKAFQDLCSNNVVLVATDTTTLVAYINKEGGMKSALLWRILTWFKFL